MRKILILLAAVILVSCAGSKTKNVCKNTEYIKAIKDKAIDEFNRANYQLALEDMLTVKDCEARDPEVYYWLGRIYYARVEKEKARTNLEQALSLNPQYPEANEFMGMMFLEEGKYDQAISYLKTAATNDRYRLAYQAWNSLGWIYLQQGKLQDAEAAFARSLALNPNFCWAHCNLGELKAKQKNYAAAYASYQKALELCPDLPRAHRLLGLEYTRQGKRQPACTEFSLALKYAAPDSEDGKSSQEYLKVLNCPQP
jgi:Tfp pilus assembly protein PilF